MLALFSLQMNVCTETLIQTQHMKTFCANAEILANKKKKICNPSLLTLQWKPSRSIFAKMCKHTHL